MKRRSLLSFAPFVLAAGCSAAGPEAGEATTSVAQAVASPVPRLLRRVAAPGAPVLLAAEFPQDVGPARLVRLDHCVEADARGLLGLWQTPLVDSSDPALDGPLPSIACPDDIASDAAVYVQPKTRGLSYLEYRKSGTPAVSPATYLAIPNKCVALMNHFTVIDRGRRNPPSTGGGTSWSPPEGSDTIRLACGGEKPGAAYAGWRLGWVEGYSLNEIREFLLLQRDDTAILIDAVDGHSLTDVANENIDTFYATMGRVASVFGVPATSVDDWSPLAADHPALARPLLDMCLDRCASADWVPAHKRIVDGDVVAIDGPRTADEQRQLDGKTRKHVAFPGFDLALPSSCATAETWEKRFGFTPRALTGTWLASMVDAYEAQATQAATPVPSHALACIADAPPCRIALKEGSDFSTLTLSDLVSRTCKRTDTVVEVGVGKRATLSGRTFQITSSTLPANVTKVRIVGTQSEASSITVAQPKCAGVTTCPDPVAAFNVQGDFAVELEHLKLVAVRGGSATDVPPSVARIAISATGGTNRALDMKLRDVHIGDVAQGPFYKGIVFRSGALALYDTDVRAFTTAITADVGTVSIAAWPASTTYEIASLAQLGLGSAQLRDLRGSSLAGSIDSFRTLTFGSNVQAFLANVKVNGPLAVSWVNDRLDYSERGLWSIGTTFTNGSDHFRTESVLLSAVGRGELYFYLPTVTRFGSVLGCQARPWSPNPNVVPHIVFDLAQYDGITYPLHAGLCQFDSANTWTPTPEDPEAP